MFPNYIIFSLKLTAQASKIKNMTLAVMNYETSTIDIFSLSEQIVSAFGNDYDKYVYNVLGYTQSNVSYMVSKEINIIKFDKECISTIK